MKAGAVAGVVLIILGVAALVYQGITYTTQKKAVSLGPLQITEKQQHTIPLPPVLGGVAVVCGIVLVVLDGKK